MKKYFAAVICIAAAFIFCACADGEAFGNGKNGDSQNGGYYFESGAEKIYINEKADSVLARLGEPSGGTYEAVSCAFEGKENFYYYDGFTVQTYEKNGKKYIYTINLEDDTVKTAEGIKLGDSLTAVTDKYGTHYALSGDTYAYVKDNMKLTFIIQNDRVMSVKYWLITD